MSRHIALLRGVNVGGRNKLPMVQFKAALEGLGCVRVTTYIQSGNAIYDGKATASDIASAIKRVAGFSPQVFVTTVSALKKARAANPFARQAVASGKSVHLFLLESVPTVEALEALGQLKGPREDFAVIGRALYLLTPDGVAGSKIAERIDRTLGVATTARNWNTVEALVALAEKP